MNYIENVILSILDLFIITFVRGEVRKGGGGRQGARENGRR